VIRSFCLISSSVGSSAIVSWVLIGATDGLLQLGEVLLGVIHFDLLLELEVDHLFEFLLDGGVHISSIISLVEADVRDVLGELVVELTFAAIVLEV